VAGSADRVNDACEAEKSEKDDQGTVSLHLIAPSESRGLGGPGDVSQFVGVALDLENRLRDVVHVFTASQEKRVMKPDGFVVGCFLGDRAVHLPVVGAGAREYREFMGPENPERRPVE